jgi:hypothetical protein
MKKYLSAAVIVIMLFAFAACKKKEEEQISQTPAQRGPIIDSPADMTGHTKTQEIEFQVVVPPDVEEEWSAVKLLVEDKKLNKTREVTVQIGGEFNISDSNLTVKVEHFLPDFKMSGPIITSGSNLPKNPAVGVIILEDGMQIFPESGKWGWLYSKFPTIHPFQHERFGLKLKDGVKKQ